MQTDTQKYNESIKPNSKEIEILKKYFPQCFSKPATDENGTATKEHFDTEKLAELLNKDEVDIKKEGFTLNFLGKSYARYQANLDSETVIVPDEQNAHIQSENVYIVGDNLDALQHLKYSYAEKIKCIYIDPPYNTGKEDFVYNDKFGFTAKDFVEKLDVTEEEAERICSMNGKCTHSAWLTFMYPRLALARELLRDDGVIFISIDDNEQANLKRLCDEVFGEGNFVVCFPRVTKKGGKSSDSTAKNHDYVLMYVKNYQKANLVGVTHTDDKYCNKDDFFEERGFYKLNQTLDYDSLGYVQSLDYPIEIAGMTYYAGGSEDEYEKRQKGLHGRADWGWRWSKDLFEFGYKNGFIVSKNSGERPRIYTKTYQGVKIQKINGQYKVVKIERTKPLSTLELIENEFSNDNATKAIVDVIGKGVFEYTKPPALIKRLLNLVGKTDIPEILLENLASCSTSDIILDFFSGSATTAHAVMQLNAQDGGSRKFIMVQLDEHVKKGSEAEKAGYKTIDEIGRARIRRAAEKIKAENPKTKADLSFKTFYLKSMPQNTLDKIKTFNPNSLFTSDGDIVKTLGEDTLFQTWQIKDGFGFNCNRQKIDIAGCAAYVSEDEKIGKYLYLLTGMEEESVKELIRKIESFELTVDKIFVYGYSFDFDALNSLSTNLKTLKNRNPIEPIIRY
ncbi:site-specific DNA-methyltransferase [Treponema sp. Marseille-Q4130]|uniref:site-specific DNA-methyltransferase n=1 Tax=Treponema sp. Marseille-Q4130 TaxID=2766702 RepID=UPI001652B20F|nr:site-specific DNA-methyltransferase [Treponema sp. Marseille-Q4130]MBC6719781.1 site-specific DNA-methyltransferase [Treponema sp. Marseille-Q4130]